MKSKKIILFVVGIVLLAILLWPRGDYKIAKVENGNTIILNNGTTVKLIGIYDTDEAKEFLEDNYINVKIVLICDSSNPFNSNHVGSNETVYAYVAQKSDGQDINGTLIRSGKTSLQESTFLTDSLKSYKRFYELAKTNIK